MKRIFLALSVLVLLSGCAGMGLFDNKQDMKSPPSAPVKALTDAEVAAGTSTVTGTITPKQYKDNLVAGSGDMTKVVYDADDDGSVDGQDAEEVSVIDAGGLTDQTTVEAYLAENRTAINLNTAKDTNVSTNLSEGTATETTVDVNSSDGTNATLASASTSRAGLLSKAKFDEIVANTAKVSDTFTAATGANVGAKFSGVGTYLKADGTTGDPTGGADAAAIHDNVAAEISVITGKTTPADADVYLIEDSADSYNKKSVTIANLWANSFKAKADVLYATLTNLPGSWASPGAAIGSGTPVAGTFTTISAAEYLSSAADGSRIGYYPENTTGNEPTPDAGKSGFYFYDGVFHWFEDYSDTTHTFAELLAKADVTEANRYHQNAHIDPDNQYANYSGLLEMDPKTAAALTIDEIYVRLNEDPTTELTVTVYQKTAGIDHTTPTVVGGGDTVTGVLTFSVASCTGTDTPFTGCTGAGTGSIFTDATVPTGSMIWAVIGDDPDATTVGMVISLGGSYD